MTSDMAAWATSSLPDAVAGATSPARLAIVAITLLAIVLGAFALDPWVAGHLHLDPYNSLAGHLLRSLGLPLTWVCLGLVLHTTTSEPGSRRRALLLGLSPLLAAAIGAGIKLLVARPRPAPNVGAVPLGEWATSPWYSGAYGMPSLDAAVAAAAATVLVLGFPKGRAWWIAGAVACMLARVTSLAHHVSDVVVGGLLGWLVAASLWKGLKREAHQSMTHAHGTNAGD